MRSTDLSRSYIRRTRVVSTAAFWLLLSAGAAGAVARAGVDACACAVAGGGAR